MNELLLIASVVFIFGCVLLAYYLFGKIGLYVMTAIATVFANVEVLVLIHAFGMDQTLGNVLFGATFLITDILSECEGKKEANKAVCIGIFSSLFFLLLSQSWLLYKPTADDTIMTPLREIFKAVPRTVIASLIVYAVSQVFDVWLYHKWWAFTERKCGNSRKFLWLRNNGSTLVSQLLNTLLFTLAAFAGTYDLRTLISIFASSYVIFIFTSLIDTPAVYLARLISDKRKKVAVQEKNDLKTLA